jgi:hypothetical protein
MESIVGELGFMATSAGKAFVTLMEPHRLMFLGLGCIMGLVLGIIPARSRRDHRNRRPHSSDSVRRARRCRLRSNGARWLPDGETG